MGSRNQVAEGKSAAERIQSERSPIAISGEPPIC
jgi:hypothetical protein